MWVLIIAGSLHVLAFGFIEKRPKLFETLAPFAMTVITSEKHRSTSFRTVSSGSAKRAFAKSFRLTVNLTFFAGRFPVLLTTRLREVSWPTIDSSVVTLAVIRGRYVSFHDLKAQYNEMPEIPAARIETTRLGMLISDMSLSPPSSRRVSSSSRRHLAAYLPKPTPQHQQKSHGHQPKAP